MCRQGVVSSIVVNWLSSVKANGAVLIYAAEEAGLEVKERAETFFLGRKLEKKESHCDLWHGNHDVLPARER